MNPVRCVADTDFGFSSVRLRSEMALLVLFGCVCVVSAALQKREAQSIVIVLSVDQQQRPDYNAAGTRLPVVNPRTQTGPNLGLFSDPAFGSAGNLTSEVKRPDLTIGPGKFSSG